MVELILRIWNPIPYWVSSNGIHLQANGRVRHVNTVNPNLDSLILVSTNSLGLRGPELPAANQSPLRIICVGGSTTLCYFNPDSLTWPNLLNDKLSQKWPSQIWLNNAGQNGHSTFGHLSLVKNYLLSLEPDVMIFLVGANDLSSSQASLFDRQIQLEPAGIHRLKTVGLALTILRKFQAKIAGADHFVDFDLNKISHIDIDTASTAATLSEHEKQWIPGYRARIDSLIQICIQHNVQPIFVTQPSLYGEGRDPVTGVSLETVQTRYGNGKSRWSLMERYNDEVQIACKQNGVPCIDLANQLEKTSLYFYDFTHFTNTGNRRIAEILFNEIYPLLSPQLD